MTLICEGFLVYLVEVNCPVLLWLVSSTTWLAFLSWTFICQADWSLFHVSVSGWMILHSSQSVFLQILLPFSKFLLLQLVLFSCLTLTSQFSSFLSILCSPSLAAYKYFCHLAVIHTSKQHWDVLMFQRSESLLWRQPTRGGILALQLPRVVTLGYLLNRSLLLFHVCKMGMIIYFLPHSVAVKIKWLIPY